MQQRLSPRVFTPFDGPVIVRDVTTTNAWGEMGFLVPGFMQYGSRIGLNQEEGTGISNHYMYKLTDLLALGATLEKLDPGMHFGRLNELVKLGSNEVGASYEGVLDALMRLLIATNIAPTPAGDAADSAPTRVGYHEALVAFANTPAFTALEGKLVIQPANASQLRAAARNNFSAMAALLNLSPVMLSATTASASTVQDFFLAGAGGADYAAWQADKSSATATNFTDPWIADRAAMLQGVIARNKDDVSSTMIGPNATVGLLAGRQYTDLASNTTLIVGTDLQNNRRFIFGTDGNDSILGCNDALWEVAA